MTAIEWIFMVIVAGLGVSLLARIIYWITGFFK